MAEFELESTANGREPTMPPSPPTVPPGDGSVGSVVKGYSLELNHYYGRLKTFKDMDPEDVIVELSGITSRLTEMRANCHRIASQGRGQPADRVRIKEIDPMIDECDRQFKYFSRLQAIRDFDLKLAGGAPS